MLPDGRERQVACGEVFQATGPTHRAAEQAAAALVRDWFVARGLWDPNTLEAPPPENISLVGWLSCCPRAGRTEMHRCVFGGFALPAACALPNPCFGLADHLICAPQTVMANRHRAQSRLRSEDNPLVFLDLALEGRPGGGARRRWLGG